MPKHWKHLLLSGLLPALIWAALPHTAQAGEEELWDAERQLEAFYTPASGLSLMDQHDYERAQALAMAMHYEKARVLFESLRERYPDFLPVQLKLAQVYLHEQNPDESQETLSQLEARLPEPAERTETEQAFYFQICLLHAKIWLFQNEPAKAVEALHREDLKLETLSLPAREQRQLLLAKIYADQGDMLRAHSELTAIIAANPVARQARIELQNLAVPMAKAFYQQALLAFREQQFGVALPLAQTARELVPQSQAYLELYLQSYERLQDDARQRFQKVRQPLTQSLKKIRWALEVDDLPKAEALYAEMQKNPDLAWFIQPEQRLLLPGSVRQNLEALENALKQKE
jgi:hypothetical protein